MLTYFGVGGNSASGRSLITNCNVSSCSAKRGACSSGKRLSEKSTSAGIAERGGGLSGSGLTTANALLGVTGKDGGSSDREPVRPVPKKLRSIAALASIASNSSVFSSIVGDGGDSITIGGSDARREGVRRFFGGKVGSS